MSLRDQHNAIYERTLSKGTLPKSVKIDRYRNATERAYGQFMDEHVRAGIIRQWAYEAMKFRLADGAWYTPDFTIWRKDFHIELIEIKGFMREAARIRFLCAREMYTMFTWRMIVRQGQGWTEKRV